MQAARRRCSNSMRVFNGTPGQPSNFSSCPLNGLRVLGALQRSADIWQGAIVQAFLTSITTLSWHAICHY